MIKITRIIAVTLLLGVISIYSLAITQDRNVVRVIFFDPTNKNYSQPIFNSLPYYEALEKVSVAIYNHQINNKSVNCNELKYYGRKLIDSNSRSSQGFYLLTACAEFEGKPSEALNYAEKAIEYDPLNTQYLMAAAVLNMNLNNLDKAKSFLDKINEIDPETNNYRNILNVYNQRKLNVK